MDQSHYYRQWWYWGGEASLRVDGTKMKLTTIPDAEWQTVEDAAVKFWDEIAAESETKKKVVDIFKKYNADMQRLAGPIATVDLLTCLHSGPGCNGAAV